MAISDVHETSVAGDGANHSSLRRRHSRVASSGGNMFDEAAASAEAVMIDSSGSDDSLNERIGAAREEKVKEKQKQKEEDRKPPDHASRNEVQDGERAAAGDNFTYRASVPVHRRIKDSPLSSRNIFKQSYAGLFNLCVVVLIAVNSRLIIENIMKYGWLINSGFWFSSKSLRDWPLLMCCISLNLFPLAAFMVEKLAQKKRISEPVIFLLHTIIMTGEISFPVLVILSCDSTFLSGLTLMMVACIIWLKLVSYAHASHDLRSLSLSIEKGETLPNNLNMEHPYRVSFRSMAYFMVAPTLCYQPSYPRTPSVRKGWVFRQLIKLVIFTGLMGFIIEQYMHPIVQNSQHPFKGNLLYGFERTLKLSVPNVYVWLCMFYCFFHLWLNILAELVQFGDREFYKDWWNAKTVDEYWRNWNMPVHKWMVRHIYFPCIRHGMSKNAAVLIAFLISAVFHELCIAVPCHKFKLWAFIGIMFQVPLSIVTNFLQKKCKSSMVGNMVFWFTFCILGQPMCVLLYYHDWMNRHREHN
uniref:O-acyltransferase n=1 Tax=Arachis hypogaea TaxID=3818 RepID=A0A291I2R1_ARAHY|nr:diacylglycerol acyltransferase 1 [Arachis hypogaea]